MFKTKLPDSARCFVAGTGMKYVKNSHNTWWNIPEVNEKYINENFILFDINRNIQPHLFGNLFDPNLVAKLNQLIHQDIRGYFKCVFVEHLGCRNIQNFVISIKNIKQLLAPDGVLIWLGGSTHIENIKQFLKTHGFKRIITSMGLCLDHPMHGAILTWTERQRTYANLSILTKEKNKTRTLETYHHAIVASRSLLTTSIEQIMQNKVIHKVITENFNIRGSILKNKGMITKQSINGLGKYLKNQCRYQINTKGVMQTIFEDRAARNFPVVPITRNPRCSRPKFCIIL